MLVLCFETSTIKYEEKNKGTTEYDKSTVTCNVGTAQCENKTIKCGKKKGTTECDKSTVTCDVGTAQCVAGTIKCVEKKRESLNVTKVQSHVMLVLRFETSTIKYEEKK